MTLLTWNHACTVGVQAMDDQHGILMDTMNDLSMALVRGCGRERVTELLDRLTEFTRMHFFSEEQLLRQTGFPALDEHCTEHQRLLRKLRDAAHRAQHGEAERMQPLMSMLRDGYLEHIEGPDQKYGPWLNEHGVE